MQQKPENLFCTKHLLAVVSVFYISTVAPFADKMIENGVSRKEILTFLNVTLVAVLAASIKAYDPNVFTPKGVPGSDKEDVLRKLAQEPTKTVLVVTTKPETKV